ncbi:hypothetical protein M1513_00115 [Patescibacteria group bacterium]|nr:hypothetical protein [Patescibacteria group bacterium]
MGSANNIPNYVASWTDKYFHQSAFEPPVRFPSKRVIFILNGFIKPKKVLLYRGVNEFNKNTTGVASWTYNKNIAKKYAAKNKGKIVKNTFISSQILLDTTRLTQSEKLSIGYDYEFDDKEVLILTA